jgi:hypothetical protein
MILALRSSAQFRSRPPYGSFVAGDAWIYFAIDARLFGYAMWGTPRPADMAKLVRLMVLEFDRPPHDALVDLSGVEQVMPPTFERLATYTVKHHRALAKVVTRSAIVRPR